MYETILPIYVELGQLVGPGQLVSLTDEQATELLAIGFIKKAVYVVEIAAPSAVEAKRIADDTQKRVEAEVAIELEKAAVENAALEAENLAKVEAKKAAALRTKG